MSTVAMLTEKGIAHPPRWLPTNVQYETIMGSVAYGVSADTSDMDVYGFAIPHRDDVFPHLRGEIPGFGRQHQRFDQYQEHHLQYADAMGGHGRTYDICVYGIVRYFQLAMENNPNIVDSLFTPANCVLHITKVGTLVREHRRLFLHKGSWHKFKGYAYSQLHKIAVKEPPVGKRRELVEKYGYDTKFAYHVVRLLCQAEQIMIDGDLDLQRNNEQLKAIRRGEWTEPQLREWATTKEKQLEQVYVDSKLRHSPDEPAIRQLLLDCLETHYGSLGDAVVNPDAALVALRQIKEIVEKAKA
jgi:uncharacterized protein